MYVHYMLTVSYLNAFAICSPQTCSPPNIALAIITFCQLEQSLSRGWAAVGEVDSSIGPPMRHCCPAGPRRFSLDWRRLLFLFLSGHWSATSKQRIDWVVEAPAPAPLLQQGLWLKDAATQASWSHSPSTPSPITRGASGRRCTPVFNSHAPHSFLRRASGSLTDNFPSRGRSITNSRVERVGSILAARSLRQAVLAKHKVPTSKARVQEHLAGATQHPILLSRLLEIRRGASI